MPEQRPRTLTVKDISEEDMAQIEKAAEKDHRTKSSFARHYLVKSAKEVLSDEAA
jgi:uncharacterized protein (DUF1778 family)